MDQLWGAWLGALQAANTQRPPVRRGAAAVMPKPQPMARIVNRTLDRWATLESAEMRDSDSDEPELPPAKRVKRHRFKTLDERIQDVRSSVGFGRGRALLAGCTCGRCQGAACTAARS